MAESEKATGSRAANGGSGDADAPGDPVSAEEGAERPPRSGVGGVPEDGRETGSGSGSGDGPPLGGPAVAESGPDVTVTERHSTPGTLLAELLPEIALAAVAVYLFYVAANFEQQGQPGQLGPAFWPQMAAVGLALAALVRIFQTVQSRNRPIVKVRSEFDDLEEDEAELNWTFLGLAVALMVGYVVATMFLGYMISTMLFLGAFIWIGGQRKWYVPVMAIGTGLLFTFIFVRVVFVSLPTGVGIFDTITVAIYGLLGIQ